MNWLIAPKTNRYFWLFHFSGWGIFVLINLMTRQFAGLESLHVGIASLTVVMLINTLLCLLLREIIHRFNLLNAKKPFVWFKLGLFIVLMGFISSVLINLAMGLYYLLFGFTKSFVFFMIGVYQNWLVMVLVLGLWAVVYIVFMNLALIRKMQFEQNQIKLQLKEAELNNLIGQLNPHFLFNGLNNIRSLILEDTDKARKMLTDLADILRYSLNTPKMPLTELRQEIEVVRGYVELAKIQYENRLSYQEDVDPQLLRYQVPPMLIQLLVENAIRHGIDNHVGKGVLSLIIKQQDQHMQITVANPGQLSQQADLKQTGIGLKNIRKRLRLLFADQAGLSIQGRDHLVEVVVKMPLISAAELGGDQ